MSNGSGGEEAERSLEGEAKSGVGAKLASDAAVDQPWRILHVDDNETLRNQVREYLHEKEVAGRKISLTSLDNFDVALDEIQSRRVDILILDVSSREGLKGMDEAGVGILRRVQETGFVCAVFYTAFPERVESLQSHFVRVVSKEDQGLPNLKREIEELFALRIPQMHRAIVAHIDATLRDYMWSFVEKNWNVLGPIADQPAFLRVVLNRLVTTLSNEGVERVVDLVFGAGTDRAVAEEKVHPAQYYVMPPLRADEVLMGDLRVRIVTKEGGGTGTDYLVVLWPSCDMVNSGARKPKTDRIICAVAGRLDAADEVKAVKEAPDNKGKRKALERMLRNNRDASPDRYHVLPSLCGIPDLLVDFQKIEVLKLNVVSSLTCLATIASPYAELLADRFGRYIGRLGTPDLDISFVTESLGVKPEGT